MGGRSGRRESRHRLPQSAHPSDLSQNGYGMGTGLATERGRIGAGFIHRHFIKIANTEGQRQTARSRLYQHKMSNSMFILHHVRSLDKCSNDISRRIVKYNTVGDDYVQSKIHLMED